MKKEFNEEWDAQRDLIFGKEKAAKPQKMKLFKKLPTIETWIKELERTEMDPNLRGELIEKSINMKIDRDWGIVYRLCAIAVSVNVLLPLLIILVHLVKR